MKIVEHTLSTPHGEVRAYTRAEEDERGYGRYSVDIYVDGSKWITETGLIIPGDTLETIARVTTEKTARMLEEGARSYQEGVVRTLSNFLRDQSPDVRANWARLADALASGQYQQCKYWLRERDGDNHRYCTLGVAVRVLVPSEEQEMILRRITLPDLDCVPLGLKRHIEGLIVEMNDKSCMPFTEIAGVIRDALARAEKEKE